MHILVATDREVLVIDVERGTPALARGIDDRPTCLAADVLVRGRAWCGTHRGGVFRSDDGGRTWQPIGLAGRLIMAVAASSAERDVVWAGTEPSEVWRSGDAGNSWEQTSDLTTLPSSSRPARSCPRSMVAAHGATVFRVDRGTPTSSAFIARLPILCASRPAMDITRVTTPAPRGTRPVPASRSATCAAWRLIRSNLMSSSYQPPPDHTPRTSPVARMADCTGVLRVSAGSACATAGRSHPAQSPPCLAPARRWRNCGPRMNVACTSRMTAGRVGGAWPAMQRRRSTCEALCLCANVQSGALPHRRQ